MYFQRVVKANHGYQLQASIPYLDCMPLGKIEHADNLAQELTSYRFYLAVINRQLLIVKYISQEVVVFFSDEYRRVRLYILDL
jgi:hypothetical protein